CRTALAFCLIGAAGVSCAASTTATTSPAPTHGSRLQPGAGAALSSIEPSPAASLHPWPSVISAPGRTAELSSFSLVAEQALVQSTYACLQDVNLVDGA